MDFSIIIDNIVTLLRDNPLIVIALTVLLIIMLFRKPKLFLIISFITLILAAALYVISVVSYTGATEKKELIDKSVKDLPKE
jgi:Ca2+/Na+ antiporter